MIKKSSSANISGGSIKNENMPDWELHKPISGKFEKMKSTINFYGQYL